MKKKDKKAIRKKIGDLHGELQQKHGAYCLSEYGHGVKTKEWSGIEAILVVGQDSKAIDKWEKKIDSVEALYELDALDHDITRRIADLHEIKGMQAERDAFRFYRDRLWKIKELLR